MLHVIYVKPFILAFFKYSNMEYILHLSSFFTMLNVNKLYCNRMDQKLLVVGIK